MPTTPSLRVLFAFAQNYFMPDTMTMAPLYESLVFAANVPVDSDLLFWPSTERPVLQDLEARFQTMMRSTTFAGSRCWREEEIGATRVMGLVTTDARINGDSFTPFVLARASHTYEAVEDSALPALAEAVRSGLEQALKVPVVSLLDAAAETLDRDPRGVDVSIARRFYVAGLLSGEHDRDDRAFQDVSQVIDAAFRAPVLVAQRERWALEDVRLPAFAAPRPRGTQV